ncbi:Protein fmp32, mitochondrial [Rhodosporidiobolus nylandii]
MLSALRTATRPQATRLPWPALAHRAFHPAPVSSASHFFDTHASLHKLQQHGLTREQAEGVVQTLEEIMQESLGSLQEGLVSRAEHYKVDFSALKQSLELSERTDFINLRAENERLLGDINRLQQKLREEISRTQAGVRLDLNLEKGRIRDEMATREGRMGEVETRIENEIGLLRASMEAVKFNILQYAFAVMSGTGALLLAYLRMFAV